MKRIPERIASRVIVIVISSAVLSIVYKTGLLG
jgi:hypothetical protein